MCLTVSELLWRIVSAEAETCIRSACRRSLLPNTAEDSREPRTSPSPADRSHCQGSILCFYSLLPTRPPQHSSSPLRSLSASRRPCHTARHPIHSPGNVAFSREKRSTQRNSARTGFWRIHPSAKTRGRVCLELSAVALLWLTGRQC